MKEITWYTGKPTPEGEEFVEQQGLSPQQFELADFYVREHGLRGRKVKVYLLESENALVEIEGKKMWEIAPEGDIVNESLSRQ